MLSAGSHIRALAPALQARQVERMFRASDLQRFREIARTLHRYGFWELLRQEEPEVGEGRKQGLPESKALRFRMMLEELGPTFIKLGQVLSMRPDLVSAEYIVELRQLQDRCEPLPFEVIRTAVEAELQGTIEQRFRSFAQAPLATASIAQVHEAETLAGDRVVVKVQRPGIGDEFRRDIDILYRIAKLLELVFEESATVEPVGVIEEFDRGIFEELNFLHEASNARAFKQVHESRPHIQVPSVFEDLSTTSVLTLSFLEGTPFNRLPKHADKKAIARRLVKEAFEQVFTDGLFHGDPHAGNLLYLGPDQFGVLDFGLLGRLTRQMQETLVVLALSVSVRDPDSAARTLYRLGRADRRVSMQALRDDIADLFSRYLGKKVGDVDSRRLSQELLSLALRHNIRVPPEYSMLGRAASTLEGIVREFDPDLDAAEIAKPYAEKLLRDRVAPENFQSGMYKTLLQMEGFSHDLPMQLSQIVSDLSSNQFGVRVQGRSLDRLSDRLLTASYTVSTAIVGGAFIIGSFIGLAKVDWSVGGVPLVGLMGAIVGLSVMFWLSAFVVFRPRLRKLSLSRLLFKRRGF